MAGDFESTLDAKDEVAVCPHCETDHAGLPDDSMEARAACIAAQAAKIAALSSDVALRLAAGIDPRRSR